MLNVTVLKGPFNFNVSTKLIDLLICINCALSFSKVNYVSLSNKNKSCDYCAAIKGAYIAVSPYCTLLFFY
jgi:hypothetical protein